MFDVGGQADKAAHDPDIGPKDLESGHGIGVTGPSIKAGLNPDAYLGSQGSGMVKKNVYLSRNVNLSYVSLLTSRTKEVGCCQRVPLVSCMAE